MVRTCVFCGSTDLSNEHVFPQWLGELLPYKSINQFTIPADTYVPQKRGSHKSVATLQVGRVCRSCNSGWMSALETAAKPWIGAMALGNGVVLTSDAQAIVSEWLVKTYLTSMLTNGAWLRHQEFFRDFYANRMSTNVSEVTVGAYSGEKGLRTVIHYQGLAVVAKGNDGEALSSAVEGHVVTIAVGHLVGQVAYVPGGLVGPVEAGMLRRIRPASDDFIWPRGIMSADMLDANAKTQFQTFPGENPHPNASIPWSDFLSKPEGG